MYRPLATSILPRWESGSGAAPAKRAQPEGEEVQPGRLLHDRLHRQLQHLRAHADFAVKHKTRAPCRHVEHRLADPPDDFAGGRHVVRAWVHRDYHHVASMMANLASSFTRGGPSTTTWS